MFARTQILVAVAVVCLAATGCDKSSEMTTKIRDLEQKNANLREENESLVGDLEDTQKNNDPTTVRKLEKQIASLRDEITTLQAKADDANRLAKELHDLKAKTAATPAPGSETATTQQPAPANDTPIAQPATGSPAPPAAPADSLVDNSGTVKTAVSNAVVVIEGDKSVGTGFLAREDGVIYLYTAAHVLSGNSKLTVTNAAGRKFTKFGFLEIADKADLARMRLDDAYDEPLEVAPVAFEPVIQMEVAALGNGGGHGVVAIERGRILGVSDSQVEIDAAVIQGNSGGPVLVTKSGQAIGVVTHLTSQRNDLWSDGTRQGEVRRFACRINTRRPWTQIPVAGFLASGRAVKDFDELTLLGFAFSCLEATPQGLRYSTIRYGSRTPVEVINRNAEDPTVVELIRFNTDLETGKVKYGTVDRNRRTYRMVDSLRARLFKTKDTLKPETLNPYHRALGTDSVEARTNSIKALDALLVRLK